MRQNQNVRKTSPLQAVGRVLIGLTKTALVVYGVLLTTAAFPQSGGWDANGSTGGASGYTDHGSGVIQLLNSTNTGCSGAAVHETSVQYDPCNGSSTPFSFCYQVFFDCPGSDNIGSDIKGDGVAFSFSKCAYNINNGLACGGGLGYMGACPQMITIEFDTWSSQGGSGFDGTYGGGTTGNNDEIALHRDGNASDAGRVTAVNAGNLEDGQIHIICISYDPVTDIYSVSKDGTTVFTYDATGTGLELETYFGCGGLNQTWSAGKFGATGQSTVSNGAPISPSFVSGCTPLPVGMLSFNGKKENETVVLDWLTAIEMNNEKFIIERSYNLENWEAIGEVAGAGNSLENVRYNFIDYSPSGTVIYYRLKQVDLDGKYGYSKIVIVQMNGAEVSISPNPFEESFIINSSITGEMQVSIYDVMGRLVYQSTEVNESGALQIQPDVLPGTYLVSLQTDEIIEQWKIVKK